MSLSLLLGCLWVLAASVTAMLPLRWQIWPGLPLLIAAPVLLGYIALQHGMIPVLLALFAFASMFRRPLEYLARRLLRLPIPDHLNRTPRDDA